MQKRIHVAVGVVKNHNNEVLISRRHENAHQGGLWEFPGGKVESKESILDALRRELNEELGIRIESAHPLIRVHHDYEDKNVLLDVWQIQAFEGTPHGREGQVWQWASLNELDKMKFPEANKPIMKAVKLPSLYLITGNGADDQPVFLDRLKQCLESGVSLVQLRVKGIDDVAYRQLASAAVSLCKQFNAALIINADPALVDVVGASGVHLNTDRMMALTKRPLPDEKWVGGSCHNEAELLHACKLGLDFVVLSPVLATPSHPGEPFLGWEKFRELTEKATIPVFALGGMHPENVSTAFEYGAQGVSVLSPIWNADDIALQVKRYLNK
ncbi:MAG: Nudix family hydrolase [Gammaproteobacteria bacterium]|nr:Nudix family hydrolase [Gammaproteobacteria bacterium]